jgi:hypothetical protein
LKVESYSFLNPCSSSAAIVLSPFNFADFQDKEGQYIAAQSGAHKGLGGCCACKFVQMFGRAYTPALAKPPVLVAQLAKSSKKISFC